MMMNISVFPLQCFFSVVLNHGLQGYFDSLKSICIHSNPNTLALFTVTNQYSAALNLYLQAGAVCSDFFTKAVPPDVYTEQAGCLSPHINRWKRAVVRNSVLTNLNHNHLHCVYI